MLNPVGFAILALLGTARQKAIQMNIRSLPFHSLILASLAIAVCSSTASAEKLTGGIFGPALTPRQLDAAVTAARAHPLGHELNPVRVNMPPGERAYLARLRCSDGKVPEFNRGGSTGVGPYGNILDVYNVRCTGGTPAQAEVYMDMYHGDHVETQTVPGFTIVAP